MSIVGIGVDVVDIARFERGLIRTPALQQRLFAQSEQERDGAPMPLRSLAGRFAAKGLDVDQPRNLAKSVTVE